MPVGWISEGSRVVRGTVLGSRGVEEVVVDGKESVQSWRPQHRLILSVSAHVDECELRMKRAAARRLHAHVDAIVIHSVNADAQNGMGTIVVGGVR